MIDAGSPIESSPTWRIEHPTTPEGAGLALPRRVVPAAEIAAAPGWRIAAVVGVACVVLGLSVVWRGDPSETVAGFWPPAGVGFVALLLVPRRRWGWVIAGILAPTVVGLASGAMSLRAGLIWGAANCVGPAVGASLLQRLSVAATPLQGRPLLTYLVCGPLVGPAVGGALGAIGSTLDYDQTWAGAWSAWILADGLGVLVVTSLVLVRLERPPQPRRPRELIVLTAFVLATAALTFVPLEGEASALLPYLVLVALVWAGMCFGPRLAGAAGFVVALAANVATSSELGPWSGSADGTGAIALQGFLVVAIVTSVVVGSMAAQLADRDEVNRLLRHQATHDALTGLPNRALLAEHLHRVLGDPDGDALGILLVDLDGFHEVNDRHGREVGDLVLRAVARRMAERLSAGDRLARLGGDELALVRPGLNDRQAVSLGEAIAADLAQLRVDGLWRPIRVHVGAATVRAGDPIAPADLVHRADLALARAKQEPAPAVAVFDEALEASTRRVTELTEELRGALARQEVTVAYQPIADLRTGRITGLEALVRWTNRRFGAVPPDEFVPVAEDAGLIGEIGLEVLRRACRDVVAWRADRELGHRDLHVAVNVSPHQLTDPELVQQVAATLDAAGLPPHALTLEITETAVMHDLDVARRVLAELRSLGSRISMDDFGTGHSSMRNLRQIPLDILKIDRSFVAGLGESPEDTVIVESVIRLGHSFGLAVVAEGVETDAQRRHLERLGCDRGQGYLWSRPAPAAAVPDLLASVAPG